ncbi:type I secretion system permease/ATPase [Agrobacterium tumefaciens]|uniref:type I secretion system permease/ATPase n=1 Tax=Agrobacterium tumefaciens TaxID=358 RepID=UPI0021D3343B|nr:type I secretion system permease/ATPase [Agrobacterium tumefaciens]UXT52249.1 type I secretion system permease/ATPase [Agrobacterium tumefaciens]
MFIFNSFFTKNKRAFFAVGLASALMNILNLSGSLFMLEVYDRILPSKSIPSLVALVVLLIILYAFLMGFDMLRSRILARISDDMDDTLNQRLFRASIGAPLLASARIDGLQIVGDLDQIRQFLSGPGPGAFFDIPWLPIYLLICFALHPWIGFAVLGGAAILVVLTLLTNWLTEKATKQAYAARGQRNALVGNSQRNIESIKTMGMMGSVTSMWNDLHSQYRSITLSTSDTAGTLGAISRTFRLLLQSGVMAIGAVLVIEGNASAGSIIAGSILSAKALGPVEHAIANWRSFMAARQGWKRINEFLELVPEPAAPLSLPRPQYTVAIDRVTGGPPNGTRDTVADISFTLNAGDGLGIIGPSASGKSTLARLMTGIWPYERGSVRFDGAALNQWDFEVLGKSIGYMPQQVELMPGTVAQNIARFDRDATAEAIVAAAKAAQVHELILNLPNGYDTYIGDRGEALSGGQKQRIGLARALFGEPFFVLLDEPNSNLDSEGEMALRNAIGDIRARGGIVVVIAHRPSAIESVNLVMVMSGGRMLRFGTKEEVLAQILRQNLHQVPAAEEETRKIENRVSENG